MAIRRTEDAAAEPITLEEAKRHLRVDLTFEDDDIETWITAARQDAEDFQGRAWITQTWMLTLDHFPGWCFCERRDGRCNHHRQFDGMAIKVPRPPLQSINFIKYLGMTNALDPNFDSDYDPATGLHTMNPAIYQVDTQSTPGRIAPITTSLWPYIRIPQINIQLNAVQIQFKAGYGDAATDLPKTSWGKAVLLALGHYWENRSSVLTGTRAAAIEVPGFRALLERDRVEL